MGDGLLDLEGVALEGVGWVAGSMAESHGVIKHQADDPKRALGGLVRAPLLDGAQHAQAIHSGDLGHGHAADRREEVLVEFLDHVVAMTSAPGAGALGAVPIFSSACAMVFACVVHAWDAPRVIQNYWLKRCASSLMIGDNATLSREGSVKANGGLPWV